MLSVRPDCPDGKTPAITGVSGDNWAPIADSKNDYVQIGLSGSTISITLVDALTQTLFAESSTLVDALAQTSFAESSQPLWTRWRPSWAGPELLHAY